MMSEGHLRKHIKYKKKLQKCMKEYKKRCKESVHEVIAKFNGYMDISPQVNMEISDG